PAVREQRAQGLGGERHRRLPAASSRVRGEAADERREVARSPAQRQEVDACDAEPVPQILAKPARRDLVGEIAGPRRAPVEGATTWRSIARDVVSPMRCTSPLSSTRNRRAWVACESSATSSRNSVPPDDASISPARAAIAPVNAPLACPNSSASARPSGIAAQFTATNGWCALDENWWIAEATRSFPLPVG